MNNHAGAGAGSQDESERLLLQQQQLRETVPGADIDGQHARHRARERQALRLGPWTSSQFPACDPPAPQSSLHLSPSLSPPFGKCSIISHLCCLLCCTLILSLWLASLGGMVMWPNTMMAKDVASLGLIGPGFAGGHTVGCLSDREVGRDRECGTGRAFAVGNL